MKTTRITSTCVASIIIMIIIICDFYGTPEKDVKKDRIKIHLKKWRKAEPPFVYG